MGVGSEAILGLPFPTKFFAGLAQCIGDLGLVGPPFTNAYHLINLGQTRPRVTFTNHYRRTEHITHSDWTMCYAGL